MARNEQLVVDPEFYDILSGGFYPPSDVFGRAHTLGRIATAVFRKGRTVSEIQSDRDAVVFKRYTPSWARTITAEIQATRIPLTHVLKLSAVVLIPGVVHGAEAPRNEMTFDFDDIDTEKSVIIYSDKFLPTNPYQRIEVTPETLDTTRMKLAAAAQIFFKETD